MLLLPNTMFDEMLSNPESHRLNQYPVLLTLPTALQYAEEDGSLMLP
jgi:hypothetical protein